MASSKRRDAGPLLYLIDASSYVFRAFHAVPHLSTSQGIPTNAVFGVTNMLLKLMREVRPEFAVAVFDAPGKTFRDELYSEYKANRPRPPDELIAQLPIVRRVVPALGLPTLEEPDVEADDVIGTLTRRAVDDGVRVVIVTGDKDMAQLVGGAVELWDTMRDRWTRLDDVRKRFGLEPTQLVDVMALMGDATDNIPGVTGIGEKTASALIRHFGSVEKLLADPGAVAEVGGVRGAARIAETLRREADRARLSRELATIRCDLAIDFSLDSCRVRAPNREVLGRLLNELEFSSLAKDFAPDREELSFAATEARAAEELAAACRSPEDDVLAIVFSAGSARSDRPEAIAVAAESGRVVSARGLDWKGITTAMGPVLGDARIEKLGDDLKGLMLVAARNGVEVSGSLFDTRVASYLINPTQEGHDLASLVERRLGSVLPEGADRTAGAAAAARRLRPELERELVEREAWPLFRDVEMPLVRILAQMERRGVLVDTEKLAALSAEYGERLDRLLAEARDLAGGDINLNSPPQLRAVLFDRLKLPTRGIRKGKTGLSTDVDVLKRLSQAHPLPAKILEYRALSKLRSTYLDALPQLVDPETGRIHTTFHQTVAATGRLSSSDPNLQNIPVRGEEGRRIRACFTADPGRALVSADYSQIELRILAHLSQDAALLDAFRSGEDVHTRTAAEVFGGLSGVSEDMRRAAKAINFGIIYGMGPARLARELEIPQDEAGRYIRRYFERYAGVRAFLDRTVEEARRLGYVKTILNRRRYLPELSSREGGARQFAERMAVNTPIQGSAADLIKVAMLRVDRRLSREGLDAWMLLQVHDELIFEVAADDVDATMSAVRAEMENVVELAVPFRVEVRAGSNWAQVH